MSKEIELIQALLSGKRLKRIHHGEHEELFWCERNNGEDYFYVHGWGSAYGNGKDRLFDVLKSPTNWQIESDLSQPPPTGEEAVSESKPKVEEGGEWREEYEKHMA